VTAGPDFLHTIGFFDSAGQAWDTAKQPIGRIHTEYDPEGDIVAGGFEQRGVGYLTRAQSWPPPAGFTSNLDDMPFLGPVVRDSRAASVRYSSPDCAGFTVGRPPGGVIQCHATVHDDRIDRILLAACCLREMRKGKLIDAAFSLHRFVQEVRFWM
jgi:hypothetical protein